MKDQYFGDVNDYVKYGLIRFLAREMQLSVAVCWMLTAATAPSEGKKLQYLDDPHRWRHLDPELFDALYKMDLPHNQSRSVALIEQSTLLPRTSFFTEILPDDAAMRRGYFGRLWQRALGADLIFFDPDNGMEVASVPAGEPRSSKYLYWTEAAEAFRRGHSLVLFQHFTRVERRHFIAELAARALAETHAPSVVALRSSNVVFLAVIRPDQASALQALASAAPMGTEATTFPALA